MKLNCKPGDLARIISVRESRHTGSADKIIKVTEIDADGFWGYEGPRLVCVCPCAREMTGFHDELLRPIRGQDGDDETLAWAGRPTQVDVPEVISA